ncbi:MAG: GP88 family protein [Candidatus Thorarchaeota archaeon]|jgi:hypothetical protein
MPRRGLTRAEVKPKIAELLAADDGVKISVGNDKLDNIPNISLLPGDTCPGSVEECKYCYAKSCMRCSTWAEVRWTVNTFYAKNQPRRFELDVKAQVYLSRTDYFRIHVGGDFYTQEYLEMWFRIANEFPTVRFLAFTKSFMLDWKNKPSNMIVIWSVFPSTDFDAVPSGPRAWTKFDRIKRFYPPVQNARLGAALKCAGTCRSCGMCYHNDENKVDVSFDVHGSGMRKPQPRGENGKWLSNSSIVDE